MSLWDALSSLSDEQKRGRKVVEKMKAATSELTNATDDFVRALDEQKKAQTAKAAAILKNEALKRTLSERQKLNAPIIRYNQQLTAAANAYVQLLSKPLEAIAQAHDHFAATYLSEQQHIVPTIGNKSFKDVAFQLGLERGLTSEEIEKMVETKVQRIKNETNTGDLITQNQPQTLE